MTVKKICVLGLGVSGVPLSAVIALKCPEIRVTVVQTNPDIIYQWNSGLIPPSVYVPGLDDLIRKSQNKNLFFTTNEKVSINEADIIFITSVSKMKTYGENKNQVVDLSLVEEAGFLIAEHAESSKIVVESSSIPLKTTECLTRVLKHNSKPRVEFLVLSNPEFGEQGSPLRNLIYPDCVLIGSEDTPKANAAAKKLVGIYERWVVPKNILLGKSWTVELSKISISAIVAQTFSSIQAMCTLFEECNGDISPLLTLLEKDKSMGSSISEVTLNVGKFHLSLRNLIFICESHNLSEAADYWRQVLEMYNFFYSRFFKRILISLNKNAWSKQITLLGFAYYKDTEFTEGSSAVFLCKSFLEENALINIYDPRVTKKHVIDDMTKAGCTVPHDTLKKLISVYNDPYKAIHKSQAVIVCGVWPEFAQLDFKRVFEEMQKPAYIFDSALLLPHSELLEIGFKVYCVGKNIKNNT